MHKLLRQKQPPRLRDGKRRRAEMTAEETPQLPLAETETFGERGNRRFVERAFFHQSERARDRVRRAAPGGERRRDFGTAAQARPKAGLLRRGGGGKEGDVLAFRRRSRADRTAVDSGRAYAGEKTAVESGVARANGTVAGVFVECSWCRSWQGRQSASRGIRTSLIGSENGERAAAGSGKFRAGWCGGTNGNISPFQARNDGKPDRHALNRHR